LKPWNFDRFIGDLPNIFLNDSTVNASQSRVEKFSTSGNGVKFGSVELFVNRFHGQTSWHTSQPNIQLLNFPFISAGIISSFSSMVK
jgi:hypothetical protein